MNDNNEKLIELRRLREITMLIAEIQEIEYKKQNNIQEQHIEGKPKVLVLTKKFNGRELSVAWIG